MILSHLLDSNPGHAGRPGEVGGSAPSSTPPPPPGAAKAYGNLKKEIAIPNTEEEYRSMSEEYTKVFNRLMELKAKVFKRTATPEEQKEYQSLNSEKEDRRTKMGIFERETRKTPLDTQLKQKYYLSKDKVNQTPTAEKPKIDGGWKNPEFKTQYAGILKRTSDLSNQLDARTAELQTGFDHTAPGAAQQLKDYVNLKLEYDKSVKEKEKFFQDNYVVGN